MVDIRSAKITLPIIVPPLGHEHSGMINWIEKVEGNKYLAGISYLDENGGDVWVIDLNLDTPGKVTVQAVRSTTHLSEEEYNFAKQLEDEVCLRS